MWDNPYEEVELSPLPIRHAFAEINSKSAVFTDENIAALDEMMTDGVPGLSGAAAGATAEPVMRSPLRLSKGDPLPLGLLQLARLAGLFDAASSGESIKQREDLLESVRAGSEDALTPEQLKAMLLCLVMPQNDECEAAALDLIDSMLSEAFNDVSSALDITGWSEAECIIADSDGEENEDDEGGGGGDAAAFERLAVAARESDCIAVGDSEYCVTAFGCQVAVTESQLAVLMVAMDSLREQMMDGDDDGKHTSTPTTTCFPEVSLTDCDSRRRGPL